MNSPHISTLDTFDINSLPDLGTVVLGALDLFQQTKLPALDLSSYRHPLIVGSGNAEATGRIIFQDTDAVFASESDYQEKLETIPGIDGVVLISASGGKHAPIIAKMARGMGKNVTLITNTQNSPADQYSDSVSVFPKNREPYTYNTSTYMGMILGKTGEDPAALHNFLQEDTAKLPLPDLGSYTKFYFIIPPQFAGIVRMLNVKFIELFGRNISRDIETSEYVRHATTVAPSNELFVSFGDQNTTWGKPENRLHVPLPQDAGYASMMAVGYYFVSQIQKSHPQWFKENIESYCREVSKVFGSEIKPIVDK